jgi:hypothetical protein
MMRSELAALGFYDALDAVKATKAEPQAAGRRTSQGST